MGIRHFALALVPLLLAACAPRSDSLQHLVGQPISGVIAHAGAPTRETAMADGSRVLEYTETSTRMRFAGQRTRTMCPGGSTTTGTIERQPFGLNPTYTYSATTRLSGSCYISGIQQDRIPVEATCTDVFLVDQAGIVRSINSHGDC